jgi:EAL domain-containing protein (putative c-di-GMP-specific phosphodiesterase class I)
MPCRDLCFLVVEDHPFQRMVLAQLLRSMGAGDVRTAEDGRAALEVVRAPGSPVDIVISDLSMPGMDGMEFVRHVGELGVPVSLILTSALDPKLLASVGEMARAYKVRLLGVVDKPVAAHKLAPLIELHHAVASHARRDPAATPLDEIATSWTNQDFVPWFLPELELATNRLRRLHATPRWRHPERGTLLPEAFLPSVQARGLADDFGQMLLEEGAACCARWSARGVDAGLSLPLLFGAFDEVDLAQRITAAVVRGGAAPASVLLVVRASGVGPRAAPALENLARLRMEGFALALERGRDAAEPAPGVLGAFTHLRLAPALLAPEAAARRQLQSAFQLAREAGLRVTAEGVQYTSQADELRELGCESALGPVAGPALEPQRIVQWARRQHRAAAPASGEGQGARVPEPGSEQG